MFIPKSLPVLYGFVRYFATGIMATVGVTWLLKLLDLEKRIPGKKKSEKTLDNEAN